MKIGFDNDKYLRMQSKHIRERIFKFGGKPYLKFGGKFFDDYHASRVLPGFQPDSKLHMLLRLADQTEIVIAISAADIERDKIRGDLGITYNVGVLHPIQAFHDASLYVGSVVITYYTNAVDQLKSKLKAIGIKVYRHCSTDDYPADMPLIVSEDGYGKNKYIETTRPLVIVAAPGPGSSKMATCLSRLCHESRHGVRIGYAKFETFPIWNLPLNHLVNLAYEAAITDLSDVNMIDPFHLEAYGKATVNYNRGVETFPVPPAIFEGTHDSHPYKSPTDMGINMTDNCIVDDGVCRGTGRQEIIRRWYTTMDHLVKNEPRKSEVTKVGFLMRQAGVTTADRPMVYAALLKAEVTGTPAATIELPSGCIVTGKAFKLLGASAAVLLNAVRTLGDTPDEIKLISLTVTESIQALKVNYLGSKNPRLHTDEILIALSMSAASNPSAAKALGQLKKLRGCQVYTSVMLSGMDIRILNRLGLQLTSEPHYENKKIYH